jgi:signal recognition particle subunit SEC65
LDKNGNPRQPLEIKGIVSKFRKAYEEKTGLEYEMPSLKEIVEAVETVHINIAKADKAKANWNEELERKQKERIFDESQKEKAFIEKEVSARDYVISKLKDSQDVKELQEIIGDEDEVIAAFNEEHEFLKKGVRKDSDYKPRGYPELVKSLGKAKLFDKLAEKYKSLQAEYDELKGQRDAGLPPPKGRKPGDSERSREKPKEITKDNLLDMFKDGGEE